VISAADPQHLTIPLLMEALSIDIALTVRASKPSPARSGEGTRGDRANIVSIADAAT
jgi:hypothetical protein